MTPTYGIIFLGDIEERFFSDCDISSPVWWEYINDIFMLWQLGKKELKKFLEILNSYHPTINFTTNYLRDRISFLDAEVIGKANRLVNYLYKKPRIPTNIFPIVPIMFFILKTPFLITKP